MPEVWDNISDLVSWLSAGKVAVLTDSQWHNYSISYWSWEEDEMNCIWYDQSSARYVSIYIPYTTPWYIVDSIQIINRGFVPDWWTAWQVLTQTSTGNPDWQNPTWTTYNAGEWIKIWTVQDYSAMRWPCPEGFHVPSKDEWTMVKTIWTTLWWWNDDWTNFWLYLKIPFAWLRNRSNVINSQWTIGYYWNSKDTHPLFISGLALNPNYSSWWSAYWYSIRAFKNTPTIPDNSWTKLYWTSIENWWIFWNSTDWLISLSSDWQTWITIQDKNLWATTVWSSWATLSEANCWKYFQRWNNYWFAWTWGTAESTTRVDASNYWPWNYYNSSTFIKSDLGWDSSNNQNLRWWEIWVVTLDNVITNTWVLVSDQPNNILTSWMKIWAWTETDYWNLGTYDNNTLYLVIE
jgi:hypothetical protein